MIEKIKKITLFFLIALSLIQVIIYNNSIKKIEEVNNRIVYDKPKNIKKLCEELNNINNNEIISAQKENDIWKIKIKINGEKENIMNELAKLKDIEILNYSVKKNNEENCVVVEINGK